MNPFTVFVDGLYDVLKFFQHLTEPILGNQSYWFAIVLLTVAVRTLLIPLTVKQVRSTRAMSELQPEIKRLQAKYKNDKQKLNEELMALYREKGFNPLMGCLPLLAQAPFFFALYRVIYNKTFQGEPNILLNHTFFGVPLDLRWSTLQGWGEKFLSQDGLTILLLVVAMSVTTYISQRQLMSRQTAQINPQQQMLMRVLPLTFLFFAINVPLAVIIYWVTTNLWSMGQQYLLLRNQPVPAVETAAPPAAASAAVPADGKRPGLLASIREMLQGGSTPEPPSASKPQRPSKGAPSAKPPLPSSNNGKASSAPKASSPNPHPNPNAKAGDRGGSGQARGNRQGGTRKSGSANRPPGKGKPGGQQRRGKR